jgi:hypothetical protein
MGRSSARHAASLLGRGRAGALRSGSRAAAIAGRARRRLPVARPSVDVVLIVVVVLAGVFYEWTASTSVPGQLQSPYYLLAGGFLHLHTYLPVAVPAALEALPNPYDPAANAVFGLHDLAYYKGHLYLSWLPTPVLTLYLPLRLLGIELTDASAVPIYSFAALIFGVLLLRLVIRRFVPQTKNWALVLGACAIAFGTAIPFLLRRPAIYEVAIASGACFIMAALYLLARGLLDERGPRRGMLAGASLCAGLAFASRPTLLLGAAVFLAAAVALRRLPGLTVDSRRRMLLALLGPLAASILLVGAYNAERFGSPTQFGVGYVLASIDQSHKPTFEFPYIAPGVYNFALAPPRLALTFPHVFLPPPPGYPGTLPAGYAGTPGLGAEPTGGVIPMAPIVLFAAAIPLLWRRRREIGSELPLIVAALWLLGTGILVGLAFTLFATTERYEVDFDLLLILAGVLGWVGLLAVVRGRVRRRIVAVGGALAIAWACFTGVAVSLTGYYNNLLTYHPALFAALEDITSPFATLATTLLGHPVIARVQSPAPIGFGTIDYGTFGEGHASTYLGDGPVTLVVLAPGAEDLSLRTVVSNGPVPAPAPLQISVSSPGRRPIVVAVAPGDDLLPIHVHWGLNRITLDIAEPHTVGLAIGLGDMVLVKSPPPSPRPRAPRHHPVASTRRASQRIRPPVAASG